jgi:hypothetical protein
MINQLLGFMCLKWLFFIIKNLSHTILFSDFDVESFKSNIWYYYLPNGLQQWALLYLAYGIFVPILISLGLNKCKGFLRQFYDAKLMLKIKAK